jgi:hypothetical protein
MKIPPLLMALLLLAAPVLANEVIPVLTMSNAAGTKLELRDVRVMKVEPDGLRVMHSTGTAKVPFERLPEDLLAKYGITADGAKQHRADGQPAGAPTATATAAASAPSAPAASPQVSNVKLVTKDDIKAAWLRECETCFVCPQDPQGAAKRQTLAQRAAAIRSGAYDSTAETYAKQANVRNGAVK